MIINFAIKYLFIDMELLIASLLLLGGPKVDPAKGIRGPLSHVPIGPSFLGEMQKPANGVMSKDPISLKTTRAGTLVKNCVV